VSTRGARPARLITPTEFSGLLCVFAPARRFAASASAYESDARAESSSVDAFEGTSRAVVPARSARDRRSSAHLEPRWGVIGVADVFTVVQTQDRRLEDHVGDACGGGGRREVKISRGPRDDETRGDDARATTTNAVDATRGERGVV